MSTADESFSSPALVVNPTPGAVGSVSAGDAPPPEHEPVDTCGFFGSTQ